MRGIDSADSGVFLRVNGEFKRGNSTVPVTRI